MTKKVAYRAVAIERLTSAVLAAALTGTKKLVVAIDVAKVKMMAGFGRDDGAVVRLVRFESPGDTRVFVQLVVETGQALGVPIEALLEPTGTYGDGLRQLLIASGVTVHVMGCKRVHDAAEVFDGVPSLHDAKSCVVMAQLHLQGVSRQYVEPSTERVRLRGLVRHREIYERPTQIHLGELESLLARHWPELLVDMDVWRRKTPLELLAQYPSPAEVVEHPAEAHDLMRSASRGTMKLDDIRSVIASARRSVGVPATREDRELIRAIVHEVIRVRGELARIDATIEEEAERSEATRGIARVVGRVTAVVFVAYLGPFASYESAAALEKACGLNLKMKSSGNYDGRLSITKRGPGEVRRYLYLAALRLVKDDPLIAAWFRSRGGYRGDRKLAAVVAVMRKLIRALWHVARGAVFDSTKLVDARALNAMLPAQPTSRDVVASL